MLKKYIPNTITCGNILCGCIGIVLDNPLWMAYLILLGMLLDFADGLAARLLQAYSEMGKQLDSLADMVTFGVLPGIILYQLFPSDSMIRYTAFCIPIFSAIRLAKFNIDIRQTNSFIGLPTPSGAFLVASLPLNLTYSNYPWIISTLYNPLFLTGLSLLISILLVAEIPLFSLKFKDFSFKNNQLRYIFLILSLILFIVFQFLAIPLVISGYVIVSLLTPVNSTKLESNAK